MHILPLYGVFNKSAMLSAIGEANCHELMSWDSAVGPKVYETPISHWKGCLKACQQIYAKAGRFLPSQKQV